MAGPAVDLPIGLRENLAPVPYLAVAALEGPGSEIGVTVRNLRPGEADAPKKLGRCVVVESVAPESPASRGGLKPGDVVVFYMYGAYIDDARAFARVIQDTPPGLAFTLSVIRDGAQMTLRLIPELARAAASERP
jgi:S1-C subfamily serine protease